MLQNMPEKNNKSTDMRELRDPDFCRDLARKLDDVLDREVRFMEVCGTHTMSIFGSGLRSLMPAGLHHVSGPGCPVCVTHGSDISAFLELARTPGVMLASFGDMLRVPGPGGESLKTAQADGASVRICYSPFEAVQLAESHPDREVVFLGVGFETTAPAVAATLEMARSKALANFSIYSCHKLIPPALEALVNKPGIRVDGFLMPGHVSSVIGTAPYRFLARDHGIPSVVGGFEPGDILQALLMLVNRIKSDEPDVDNQYSRAVKPEGNQRALEVMHRVFEPRDALWRGLGTIPSSGLGLREEYADMDAERRFSLSRTGGEDPPGCRCGEVLQGAIRPGDCPLFGRSCTPSSPVGPCMVSSEGSCAASYHYDIDAL
jgi:hydrogenase expression/formation protein HypD